MSAVKKKASKPVVVDVRLPVALIGLLDEWAAEGLLGNTREEVVLHVLRHYLFAQARADKASGRPA